MAPSLPIPMAPPPGTVEVRCAGCGETLEVDPGLTEFACPDCGAQQALPPELMPRRPRRALPLPGRLAPLAAPSRTTCGGCNAVLSVPHGQGRLACPLCGAELAVPPVAAISVVAPPAAVPITPSRSAQPSEVCPGPSSQLTHADKEGYRFLNDTVTVRSKQNVGNVVAPSILEQEQTKSSNEAVDEQQADEIPKNTVHADKVQVEFASEAGNCKKSVGRNKGNRRRSKILMNSSNESPQLRRSKRLVKGSHDVLDIDPIEKIDASEAPEIKRTQADSDTSSTQYRFPRSNESDVVGATTPPVFNRCTQQAGQFPRTQMYSPETRWALPVASSNSWHDNEIPQESFSGVGQLDRLVQEICSGKKHHNKNHSHSEHGSQKTNGGGHPEDQPFSGACLQNLSASCSRLAASATTTLPTITPPSTTLPVNCSSPTSLHQQPSYSLYSQDAPCSDWLPGQTSNSSKKRRGRGPEKLMEPRKEAERPMLMPSGTESWIVQPPCPKVSNTLSILIKQNYPGIYVSDDTIGNDQSCEHVVYHWHQCPPDTKTTILDEFLKRYRWSPGHEEECEKIFDRKAVKQLMNLFCYEKQRVRQVLASKKTKAPSVQDGGREDLDEQQGEASVMVLEHGDPLEWKPFVPVWMKPKWWEMLCDHWAKDENIKTSYQQRKNRYSGKRPRIAACPPKIRLHEIVDKRDQANREAQSIRLGSHSVQGQAGSGKKGRPCDAISVSKKAQCEPLSKSSPVCVSKPGQQPMFTEEQVQEMITQALQGLNEAWEKKFLSLEQKMPSISSSHIIPNGVKKSSLAVRRSKRCKLTRQDTLDSMDEEDPDAEDDSDYQDEEEH